MAESPLVSSRVPQEVADALREVARRERRSVSQVIALILEKWHADQLAAAKPPKGGKKS
jgi:hypothetical protein